MIYWSELYKEITGRIKSNLPDVQWVDLWHEQINYLTEELPFPTPAVFVGFGTREADDAGTLVQNLTVQVDLRLFYETFSDTYDGSANQDKALAFLDRLTELHALFHGKSGQYFTEMRRIDMSREESGDAGNLYRISFECLVTDYSAQVLFTEADMNGREIEVERASAITPPNSGDNMFDTNI